MGNCSHVGATMITGYGWENGVYVKYVTCKRCGENWTERA